MEPIVEQDGESVVVTGIPTWPGWTFVVANDESWVKVVPPAGQSVTPRLWKAMPVGYVLRLAATAALQWTPTTLASAADARGGHLRRPFGGSPKHNAIVAHVYRSALRSGARPRDAVMAAFGVSQKTADRWLAEVRNAGQLGTYPDEKRAAADG